MKCPNCGKNNDDSFRFCQYCGAPTGRKNEVGKSDMLPESVMTTPSPSTVDAWMVQKNSGFISTVKGKTQAEPQLDIPLSSLEDRPDLSRDVSDLFSMDIPSGDISAIAPKARICLKCGATVADGHKFCGKCGAKFDSKFDLDAVSEDSPSGTSQKRVVERVSFVNNYVIPANQENAHFTLFHINDDGSIGDQIFLNAGENIIGRMSSPALSNDRFVSP